MKLITWNVNMAFHNKCHQLLTVSPDIAIIQEVARPNIVDSKSKGSQFSPDCIEWVCGTTNNPNKGLAAYSFNGWEIRLHESYTDQIDWVIPIEVIKPYPMHILGCWKSTSNSRTRETKHLYAYNQRVIDHYSDFIQEKECVILGDFNNWAGWDHPKQIDNLGEYFPIYKERFGLVSAYHAFTDEPLGEETQATHYFYRKGDRPFHIDYVLMPEPWTRLEYSLEVGGYNPWIEYSDHCPVMLEVKMT